MANYMNFTTSNPTINLIVIDESGSMEDYDEQIKRGLEKYRKKFLNYPEAGSIAVAVGCFDDDVKFGEFKAVKEMDIPDYHPYDGGTALNYAIVKFSEYLRSYMKEVERETKTTPIASFIFFSDGKPCNDCYSEKKGDEAIELLNRLKVNTIFVPFGEDISEEYGREKGFTCIEKIDTGDEAEEFFAEKLSSFSIEQSKSRIPIGENFFSKAEGEESSSSDYSNTAKQALEDDAWWNF